MKHETELSQIKELLPDYVSLHYVDYRDNLNGNIDLLQSCVTDNSQDKIYEYVDDAYTDCEADAIEQYMKELQESLAEKYGLSEEDARQPVFETYEDEVRDLLFERDNNDPVKDLLSNTSRFSCFWDTGLEVEDGSWRWTKGEETKWLKKIKRKLKITSSQWDSNIRVMLSQASYGGRLVVYFYEKVENLINESEKDWQSISFTNPAVAIINTYNGSGDHTELNGHNFSLPFVRENLFIDQYFKYSYVSAVCGMSQDWCKDSKAVFSFEKIKEKRSKLSPLTAQAFQDRKYAEIYRQGKCTSGDMDITRHRDVYYRNDFPCGNKCPHCGTFWID